MLKKVSKQLLGNRNILLLVLIGSLSWMITMLKNGLPLPNGDLGYWGANAHDGIWHLALAGSLSRGSILMPVFAGSGLQNYHIGFDLILALLYKATSIPISFWYFQIIPIILAVGIGILTYKFVLLWQKSKTAAFWSTFFVYFGGSFGYIVTFLRGEGIGGESLFWSQQSISTLINPPFALSLIILLAALICLIEFQRLNSKKYFLLSVLLFSSLLSVKAYAGVLGLTTLFLVSVYVFIQTKTFKILLLWIVSSVVSLILFLPLNKSAGQLVVFQPGWFLETMLALSDRFYWPKLFEAIINWRAAHIYYKAAVGYSVAFIVFLIGNLGSRVLFVLLIEPSTLKIKSLLKLSTVTLFLLLFGLGGIIAPMLYLQTGTAWNTIQFFYYALFVGALFSGLTIRRFLESGYSHVFKRSVIFFIILLTIPTSVSTLLQVYIPGRPPARLSIYEQQALAFLKTQPQGIVLTFPYDPLLAKAAISNPPRPIYLYESTAYVSAYGNHDVYLEDEVNLTIMNYQWKERRKVLDDIYASTDQRKVFNFFRDNKISYVYWVKPQFTQIGDLQLQLKNIFENKETIIFEVIK